MCCGRPGGDAGYTLVEALAFIVILSIAAASLLAVYAFASRGSTDLVPQFEARQIAQALIQEVLARPVRCGRSTPSDSPGPEPGETRATPYDNVDDYHGFDTQSAGGIRFLSGEPVDIDGDGNNDLQGYRAQIRVVPFTIAPVPLNDAWRVTVRVTPPVGGDVVMDAVRICYRS